MPSRKSRPPRLVRRSSNGRLFDTVDGCLVTLDFVADLVWLGENVCIFDEATREDRTEAMLAPVIFKRLRGDGGLPPTVDGVALARGIMALTDVRAEFERMHDRIAGIEALLQAAVHPNASSPRAETGSARGASIEHRLRRRCAP